VGAERVGELDAEVAEAADAVPKTDEPPDRLVDRRSNRRRPEVDLGSSRAPILGPRDNRTPSDLSTGTAAGPFTEGILRGPWQPAADPCNHPASWRET
jgi:hypothetical protein